MTKCKRLSGRDGQYIHSKVKNRNRRSRCVFALIAAALLIGLVSLVFSVPQFHPPIVLSAATEQQPISPATTTPSSQSSMELPTQWLDSEQQFQCDVTYVYVGKGNSEATHSHFGNPMYPKSQYPSIVYFNTTHVSNVETESCDVKLEVYLVQISTDKGTTENYTYIEGTNYRLYNPDSNLLESLASYVRDLIDVSTINGRGGHFRFNWTTSTTILGGFVGSLGTYSSKPSELSLWNAGEPNSISISVRRLGWIVANDSSILTFTNTARDENVAQIHLQKFGDGFIYNKIIPADELLQIDLFKPPIPLSEFEGP